MLGAHSQVLSLTELYAFVANNRKPFACKSCQPPESCPVWTQELTDRLLEIGARKEVYDAIVQATGTQVLVDSSKLIEHWYALTLKGIDPADIIPVHLSKSPEEYAGSEKNKTHVSSLGDIDDIADRWWRTNGEIIDFIETLGSAAVANTITVRYRDLIDHTPDVLKAILNAAGLDYEPGIERYWNFKQHPLWGNKGARSHFDSTDSHPEQWTDESERQKKLYTEQHQTLFRDEKWRDTLSRAEVDRLWGHPRIASMGALLGYAHPFTPSGEWLNKPTDTWQPQTIAGSDLAARERSARKRDVMSSETVVKIKRRVRKLLRG